MHNDILLSMDKQRVTLLVLSDLSSAFDTVNHQMLLKRLKSSFGISGTALSWLKSYLDGRSQHICVEGCCFKKSLIYSIVSLKVHVFAPYCLQVTLASCLK